MVTVFNEDLPQYNHPETNRLTISTMMTNDSVNKVNWKLLS